LKGNQFAVDEEFQDPFETDDPNQLGLSNRYGPLAEPSMPDGGGSPDPIAVARRALAPVQTALEGAGFYAYGTFDDQGRWMVASDDEAGRIDVRIGADGFEIELWTSSPGLYVEEENDFRRRALERLARMTLPRIVEGRLEPYQSAEWDEVDHGIAVRLRFEVPFTRAPDIGQLVRARLPELHALLSFVETQVTN
jgi:hypothetical protein